MVRQIISLHIKVAYVTYERHHLIPKLSQEQMRTGTNQVKLTTWPILPINTRHRAKLVVQTLLSFFQKFYDMDENKCKNCSKPS